MLKTVTLPLTAVLTVGSLASAQTLTGAKKMTQDEQQIRQVWTDFSRAMVQGDTKTLESLMGDQFTLTHITGYVQPKAEWLSQVKSGYFDYHQITQKELTVKVKGNTATLISKALFNVTIGGGRGNWNLQSTLNFVQEGSKWIVASYVARTY